MSGLPVYIDIDGTLTDTPGRKWGNVHLHRLEKVRRLLCDGCEIVLWSGGGTDYVKEFAKLYRLDGAVCIGKPDTVVDDNPNIRPEGKMLIITPERFFNGS